MINSQVAIKKFEEDLDSQFKRLEEICFENHKKVLAAFREAKVVTEDFHSTTGYGHDDIGRNKLDKLFALTFGTEAALARVTFVSGTHAIACGIIANLDYEDELVFAFGKPYDTLEDTIEYLKNKLKIKVVFSGPKQEQNNTAKESSEANWLDKEKLWQSIKPSISAKTKMICFQRSMGYSSTRPSVAVDSINFLIDKVKQINPQIVCFVDNCYGEFVEITEPKADLMAGSLIKNPGGGIAVAGGYLAGKTELIAKAADRLTAPGIGADGGINFDEGRILFQGLYQAPLAVNQMLKSSLLLARCFAELGYKCWPAWNEAQTRTDTILRVDLGQKEKMLKLCGFVQSNSPVNSHLTPIPDQTPGYQDEVIMAAGTFVEGSTSELSVDGPIREPYSAFIQGGLSCFYTKILVTKLLESSW